MANDDYVMTDRGYAVPAWYLDEAKIDRLQREFADKVAVLRAQENSAKLAGKEW